MYDYDTNNVTITIKTSSINGKQGEEEIDVFALNVVELANDILSNSSTEIHVEKHKLVRVYNK